MDRYRKTCDTKSVLKYSKELQTAVQDEACRQAIDAAKKRAAAQNVDYATFAALVSMAHIKPFERKRKVSNTQQVLVAPAWSFDETGAFETSMGLQNTSKEVFPGNFVHDRSGRPTQEKISCLDGRSFLSEGSEASFIENPLFEACKTSAGIKNVKDQQSRRTMSFNYPLRDSQNSTVQNNINWPSTELNQTSRVSGRHIPFMTTDAFKREWKRTGSSLHMKSAFLLGIPPHELPYIFRVELPPSILSDIIDILGAWKRLSEASQRENKSPTCNSSGRGNREAGDKTETECGIFNKKFDHVHIFSILMALTNCGRFSLALKLVGERSRSSAIILINCIMDCLRKNNEDSQNPCFGISCSETSMPVKENVKDELFEDSKRIRKWLWKEEVIQINDVEQLALIYSIG